MELTFLSSCYSNRFSERDHRERCLIWKTLAESYFQSYIHPSDTVMDIGAGYGEFLEFIECKKKVAVDINPDTKTLLKKGVTVLSGGFADISEKLNGTVHVIMMSNFLEHLPNKHIVQEALSKAYRLLKPNGRLFVMGPNIDLIKERYWDYFDHQAALNGKSMCEGVMAAGFTIDTYVERFLPYTMKSWLPSFVMFIRMYVRLPQMLRIFAGQSLIVARKAA